MNLRKVGKYSAFFAGLLMLLVVPVYALGPFARAYPAKIHVQGELTLTSFKGQPAEPVVLQIDENVTSLVPEIIPKGKYDGSEFHGWAIGPDRKGYIKFDGLLTVQLPNDKRISLWLKFNVEKPAGDEVPEGMYGAEGTVDVEISDVTLPPQEITWLMMKGNVTKFTGSTESEAWGHLIANAKMSEDNNWTKVNSVFSTEAPPTAETDQFTRSFYIVTLANNEETELVDSGLTIKGTWNVHERTIEVKKVEGGETTITITLTPIAEGKKGTLSATLTSSETAWRAEGIFALEIETFGKIEGDLIFFHTKFGRPLERGIPHSDFNGDRKIDILDIVRLARAFRAKLGSLRYGFDLDVAPGGEPDSPSGPDLEVNIIDIAAAAKEFGQEY